MTSAEAATKTAETLNGVCLSNVSPEGEDWLLGWFDGATGGGEPRPYILAGKDGAAELSGLLDLLSGAGPFLNGMCALAERLSPGAGDEVGPVELRALADYISKKKAALGALTRLCD